MGLNLGIEALKPQEEVLDFLDATEEDFLRGTIELLNAEAEMRDLEAEEKSIYEGCENLLDIQNAIEKHGLTEELLSIVGDALQATGIDVSSAEAASEGAMDTIKIGIRKAVEFLKKLIAQIKDYFKKWIGTQARMVGKLNKKAEAFKDVDEDELKKATVKGSRYTAAAIQGLPKLITKTGTIVAKLDEAAASDEKGFLSKTVDAIKNIATGGPGVSIVIDDKGTVSLVKGGEATRKKDATVADLGWSNSEAIVEELGVLAKIAKTWASAPVYTKAIDTLAKSQSKIDGLKADDKEAMQKLADKRKAALMAAKLPKLVGGLLAECEADMLAIPVPKKAKEEGK